MEEMVYKNNIKLSIFWQQTTKWGTKNKVVYNTPKRPEIIDIRGGNNPMKDYGWILVIHVSQDLRNDMTAHRHPSLIFFDPPGHHWIYLQ